MLLCTRGQRQLRAEGRSASGAAVMGLRSVPVFPPKCVCSTARTSGVVRAQTGWNGPSDVKYVLSNGMVDYYEVLGVDDDASSAEIKSAYRAAAKECHPDFLGDEGHDVCIMLNEAYEILSDPDSRAKYNAKLEQTLVDFEDDYTGQPLSKWMPSCKPQMAKHENPEENRAVFVDEFSCIGCKQCVWLASATFRMEHEHGRSRVFAQWLDKEDKIQASIDSCPVSCIHWVEKQDLAPLEYVMQKKMTDRVNVGIMMGGQGRQMDVFSATARFLKDRKRRQEAMVASNSNMYSATQDRARREAAQVLNKNRFGWMPSFEDLLAGAFASVISNVVGDQGDFIKVGKRKRAVRWDELQELEELQRNSPIPLERALVPLRVYEDRRGAPGSS